MNWQTSCNRSISLNAYHCTFIRNLFFQEEEREKERLKKRLSSDTSMSYYTRSNSVMYDTPEPSYDLPGRTLFYTSCCLVHPPRCTLKNSELRTNLQKAPKKIKSKFYEAKLISTKATKH